MPVKNAIAKNWASWIRGSDGILRSDDPTGTLGGATPRLPQFTVDTTYSLPTGNTWTATNTGSNDAAGTGTGNRTGCGLQYALDNCARNDIIEVTGGATYTGQFTLKYKATGSGWIYIRPSTYSSLPAVGVRVVAADASNMAKLTGATADTATVITENNTAYYRMIGLEVTTSSSTATQLQSGVIVIGNGNTSHSTVANHIVFDRCYVHGSADGAHAGRRGFYIAGENIAVIDSRVSGFYDDGADSQAILIYMGNGPFKVHNNYLEAASENINYGGVDPQITGSVPIDSTITHNHFFKPLAWIGAGHNVKNLLEFKNAIRVLVEGNTFENNWVDGQSGFSLLVTPRNQDGGAPWCETSDITVRLNKFINCAQGINVSGHDNDFPSQDSKRILIENNLIDVTGITSASGVLFQVLNGPQYLTIQHNTGLISGGTDPALCVSTNVPVAEYFTFKDNIVSSGTYGFFGADPPTADGDPTFAAKYASNFEFTKNALIAGTSGNYTGTAAGNFFPANIAAISFTNASGSFATNNYALSGASSYRAGAANEASDGTDNGCDVSALNAALA